MIVKSWGNNIYFNSKIIKLEEFKKNLAKDVIARGLGKSYGDCSIAKNIVQFDHEKKIIFFDKKRKEIECSADLTFLELYKYIIPKNLFTYVNAGSKYITIGGATASDIHGKNHESQGSFCNHIISIKLFTAEKKILECSKTKNKELFYSTCGGMGLTGIVLSVKFKIRKIKNTYINTNTKISNNIKKIPFFFNSSDEYKICWINMNSKKNQIIYTSGNHNKTFSKKKNLNDNKFLIFFSNFINIRLLNYLYFNLNNFFLKKNKPEEFNNFYFKLDNSDWRSFFKNKKLLQCQILIKEKIFIDFLNKIKKIIHKNNIYVHLITIKKFGKSNNNYLSFPDKGYTIAIDFDFNKKNKSIIKHIYDLTIKNGGKIYLAKDSLLTKKQFLKTNYKIKLFKQIKKKVDRKNLFKSLQSTRLGI